MGSNYDVGGMGLGLRYDDLPRDINPLNLSPDISDATAANRAWQPPAGGLQRSLYNPLAPPQQATAPAVAAAPPEASTIQAGRGNTVAIPGGQSYQLTSDELKQYYTLLNPVDGNAKAYAFLRGLPPAASEPLPQQPTVGQPTSLIPQEWQKPPPNALAPPGAPQGQSPPVTIAADSDFIPGLPRQVPISVFKQFLRAYEADETGYKSAWGYPGGLPDDMTYKPNGFPNHPGKPIPTKFYGGVYVDSQGKPLTSRASGMYQILPGLWDEAVAGLAKEGVTINNFKPESQEQVTSWVIRNHGLRDWLGSGPGGPFNPTLLARWNNFLQTGQMPNFKERADYKPEYAAGTGRSPVPPNAQTTLPEVNVNQNPLAVPDTVAKPLASIAQSLDQDQRLRRAMLYSALAQTLAGRQVKPPESGYDPKRAQGSSPQVPVPGLGEPLRGTQVQSTVPSMPLREARLLPSGPSGMGPLRGGGGISTVNPYEALLDRGM